MILSLKFNDSFKTASATDMMLGVYMSSVYGNNSFDFAQAARIAAPSNDRAEATAEPVHKVHLTL